ELMQSFVELGWWLKHRVAQRKIVDVVSTILLLELNALFKHTADPGRGLHMLTHALCYGHMDDSYRMAPQPPLKPPQRERGKRLKALVRPKDGRMRRHSRARSGRGAAYVMLAGPSMREKHPWRKPENHSG